MKRKIGKRLLSMLLSTSMLFGTVLPAAAAEPGKEPKTGNAQIVVDYNTSIGTGNPMIFGGLGTPAAESNAWKSLTQETGLKVMGVDVDLSKLFPEGTDADSEVLESYTHVAGGILTRIKGAGIKAFITFDKLPSWYQSTPDKAGAFAAMVETFLSAAKPDYEESIGYVELKPDTSLSAEDFTNSYYQAAAKVRSILPQVQIGGMGYELKDKNDSLSTAPNVKAVLNAYADHDQSLLQFVSFKAYGADPTTDWKNDVFGEFKPGRKAVRAALHNADMPLFLTGWSSMAKGADSPDGTITGADGIKYHSLALFKAMRDGWDMVLFDGSVDARTNAGSYMYTEADGAVTLNPFAKAYTLLSSQMGLGEGEFKVVSTDMGSSWPVDDSIAMVNSKNEAMMLLTNFGDQQKQNVSIELRNVPYEDGTVTLKGYAANTGTEVSKEVISIPDLEVHNGIITASIPIIPAKSAMGLVVTGGTDRTLPAQEMYEFESQDNHFGGNTEISWTTGASFNRTVKGFGGADNFVTLRKVAADGAGTYKAHLYASPSGNVSGTKVSVNGGEPMDIDVSGISLTKDISFDISLEGGNQNTIQFYTESGDLRPDKLVLESGDVALSIGIQNLNALEKDGDAYVLPKVKQDFVIDARIFPASSAAGKTLEYTSSDSGVVSVNENGLLTPNREGKAEITVSVKGEAVSSSFEIIVKNSVASVSVSPKALTLKQGESQTLTASIVPSDAANKNITWESSRPDIASVTPGADGTALVTAAGETGASVITVITEDGNKRDTAAVTVVEPAEGGTVTIDYGNTIAAGSPKIFGVTHYPSLDGKDSDIGDHSKVWPMLTNEAGVRFMRADARLQEILPVWTKTPDTNWAPADGTQGSDQPSYVRSDYYYVPTPDGTGENRFTLEGYRADMDYYNERGEYLNGLSNPKNWNTGRLLRWVREAKAQGYEVMAMTFQIPEWLSAGEVTGTAHTEKVCNGAPKDWEVYRDIIKKVYLMLKAEGIDSYEFLNEPHWYVPQGGDQRDPEGNAYPAGNRQNLIAADQFYQAIDAIYEAEGGSKPEVKMGGGADDSWGGDYGVLGTILSKKYEKWFDRIDFVSIHKYGERPANQDTGNQGANSRNAKYWLRNKLGREIPLYLNEYNISTGQPANETYGYKSTGWHAKNLIDMMTDQYEGGGYYTCYPADVPMDDYEASSGWIERGKGMYTWNAGEPYLANFTKTWGMLSVNLGLGKGYFDVKSSSIQGGMTQSVGAVNADGTPVALINNYTATAYDRTKVIMKNVPFEAGAEVTAKIYPYTYDSDISHFESQTITVSEDGTAEVIVPVIDGYGTAGILLEGEITAKPDVTYEFESYKNNLNGTAKIMEQSGMSNGRYVEQMNGIENAVEIPVNSKNTVNAIMEVSYSGSGNLTYILDGQEKSLPLPDGSNTVNFEVNLKEGINRLQFFTDKTDIRMDKLVKQEINKEELQKLVNREFNPDGYTEKSWKVYEEAKAGAQAVLDRENVSIGEVEAAYIKLSDAIDALVAMVDLSALITEAEAIDAGMYTTESWITFAKALTDAKEVLAQSDVSQESQVEAYYQLQGAMKALIKLPSGTENMLSGKEAVTNSAMEIENPGNATDGNLSCSYDDPFIQIAALGEDNGNPETWEPVYLQYDLGTERQIDKMDIYRTYYADGNVDIRWLDCLVEVSSDPEFPEEAVQVLFGPEDVVSKPFQETPQEIVPDSPVTARYIRIYGKGHTCSWGSSNKINISEVEVFGSGAADASVLEAMIAQAEQLQEADFTSDSFGRFLAELQRIKEILGKPDLNQAMVNQAAADLGCIMEQLVKKADFSSLNAAIDQARQLAEIHYTQASYQALAAALEAAERIAADELSAQAAIDQAETDLRDAVERLVPKADFTALNNLIEEANSKIETDYTQISYQEMRKALEAAKKTAADESAAQSAVDEAAAGLKKAMDELVLVPKTDFTKLNAVIDQAKRLIKADYTEASYQAVANALKNAERIAADKASDQTSADSAAAALKKAMDSLKRLQNAVIHIKKTKYKKTYGNKAFSLGARANCKLKYKSSNPKAAAVNSKGKVTIKGCGKATITLTASATDFKTAVKKVTVTVKPKKVGISSLKSLKKKTAAVVWKRDKKATGYQVQYSLSKKFTGSKTKVKTVSKSKTTRLELKKLKSKKTYYIRVRSYKKAGSSKIYGNWSKTKTIKVK